MSLLKGMPMISSRFSGTMRDSKDPMETASQTKLVHISKIKRELHLEDQKQALLK